MSEPRGGRLVRIRVSGLFERQGIGPGFDVARQVKSEYPAVGRDAGPDACPGRCRLRVGRRWAGSAAGSATGAGGAVVAAGGSDALILTPPHLLDRLAALVRRVSTGAATSGCWPERLLTGRLRDDREPQELARFDRAAAQ
jgi:hypothetical protein